MITYRVGEPEDAEAVAALYAAAPLRRPIHDRARLKAMIAGANVFASARDGERLVGFLRGFTDGVYDGFICDLAVHRDYHKHGIGKELMRLVIEPTPEVQWVLLASPLAKDYYGHVGWTHSPSCWIRARGGWTPGSYEEFEKEHEELRKKA
jgi:GNAT superfamily N-acetyltransferase